MADDPTARDDDNEVAGEGSGAMEPGRRRLKDLASENQSGGSLVRKSAPSVERSWTKISADDPDERSRARKLMGLGIAVVALVAVAGVVGFAAGQSEPPATTTSIPPVGGTVRNLATSLPPSTIVTLPGVPGAPAVPPVSTP